ncbi:MAG: transcriptional repressor [Archaeoglobaceae archaeon]|nr:transcriptional repressor [Archaeoglobaceae archaeon]MDW7989591.1 transcriptional repressor [Archaeoglobaceae archaeon]
MWEKKAIETIKSVNLKLTPQRLILIEVLCEIGIKHPNLREVLEKVREYFPTMSFSTLYTNLMLFKGLGLIDLFTFGDETRIEMNMKPHFNVYNGEIRDFCDNEIIKRIEEKVGRKVRFVIVIPE